MKRTIAVLALAAGAVLLVQGVTAASPGIGQGPCHHGNSKKSCRPDPHFIRPAAVRVARVGKGLEGGERASDLGKWLATSAWLVSRYSGP